MSRIIDNIKKLLFSSKKRTIITIVALVIVSFGISYLVLAQDDFAGKIVVKTEDISVSIEDGLSPFDNNDDPGNDSNNENKIVRNFDSVTYTIDYNLRIDEIESSELERETENPFITGRIVNIAVFIPKSINATISQTSTNGQSFSKKIVGDYIYETYSISDIEAVGWNNKIVEKNKFIFTISDINVKSETNLEPIIYIYESTAETEKNISPENFDINSYATGKTEIKPEAVKITGVEDYTINLFEGPSSKDGDNRTFKTAIVLGIDNSSPKGIKGKFIPSTADLKLDMSSESSYEFSEVLPSDNNYDYSCSNNFNFSSGSKNLPCITQMTDNSSNNGTFAYDASTKIASFTNIGYLEKGDANFITKYNSEDINIKIISVKVFQFKATRGDGNTQDSIITFKATDQNNPQNSKELTINDKFGKYVGNFSSSISLYDSNGGKMADDPQQDGLATYNYGDEFYISSTMNYSDKSDGEKLQDFYNYIKIDSNAIRLASYKEDSIYDLTINGESLNDADVKFIYGKWSQDYFKLSSLASTITTCPSTSEFSKLNSNQLMNLYGGPCIEINKENTFEEDSLGVEHGDLDVILVQTHLGTLDPQTKIKMKLRAIIKSDASLVNQTYQLVTNSTGKYEDTIYYLSENIDTNDTTTMSNMDNYKKTIYDFSSGNITKHEALSKAIAGETILVSAVKVASPTIDSYYNNEKRETFDEFPIRWEISTKATKNGKESYNKAEVYVYLPKYLKFSRAIVGTNNIIPEEVTSDKAEYKKYLFTFNSDQITDEGLVEFSVYTDKEFTTPEKIEQTIYVISNFYIENINDNTILYHDMSADSKRTSSKTVILQNYSSIVTSGEVNPLLIEKNKSYNYTIKAFNNQGTGSRLSLLYVLPYKGDVSGDDIGSDFVGSLSIRLSQLPSGYKVYYSTESSNTILSNEFNGLDIPGNNNWKVWNNYTTDMSGVTAVKIVSENDIGNGQYFASENGITFTITPKNNSIGNEYYNNFTVFKIGDNNIEEYINSSTSIVSVYNRRLSGFVFEDSDYDGLYSESYEKTIADIPVELYKLSATEIDSNANILDLISENDIKVDETVTSANGNYSFRGLESGNYYVKYSFNCEKYTATDKGKQSVSISNSETINSNASMLSDGCSAVSDIVSLNDKDKLEKKNINLGLAIRKVFGINLKKYITNVTINSTTGKTSYDYDNETKVKIDVKNLKNASFRVTYKFEMQNSKYFPGYVGLISENIPAGMTFDPTLPENEGWTEYGGGLYYTKFQNMLIMPDEKYYFTIVLDLATNTAGDYINIISGSNFSILGEDGLQIDFSDLNVEIPDETTDQNLEQENTNTAAESE